MKQQCAIVTLIVVKDINLELNKKNQNKIKWNNVVQFFQQLKDKIESVQKQSWIKKIETNESSVSFNESIEMDLCRRLILLTLY